MRRRRTRSGPWRSSCSSTRRTRWWSAAPVTSPCKARRRARARTGGSGLGGHPLLLESPLSSLSVLCWGPSGKVDEQEVRTCFIFICLGLENGDRLFALLPHTPLLASPAGLGRYEGSQSEGFSLVSAFQASGGSTRIYEVPPPCFIIQLRFGSFSSSGLLSLVTYGLEVRPGPCETPMTIGNG